MTGKSDIQGVYRPLEALLLSLAEMYLQLNEYNDSLLTWFNNDVGKFYIAIGADDAPFGKDDVATAYLVSFLNVLGLVASCDHNFLIMGANCKEDHWLMLAYTEHLVKEMDAIEKKKYHIRNVDVTFQWKLTPADQKWIAKMGGELNNASFYFSTFANVNVNDMDTMGGSIGSTWKCWKYDERVKSAGLVEKYKAKISKGGTSKATFRQKITTYISKVLKSRQEFKPYLGKYIDLAKSDPLHNLNNAWQQWHLELFVLVTSMMPEEEFKRTENFDKLQNSSPIVQYVNCLLTKVQATRLVKNIKKWFDEKRREDFSYRFTGKESKLLSWNFCFLIDVALQLKDLNSEQEKKVCGLAYSAINLRDIGSLCSKVTISEAELQTLETVCNLYFNCYSLFLNKVRQTTWTLAYAIPKHAKEIHKDLGYGLGLNTTQGREAKHTKLSKYAENTTKMLRWHQVFKHEYLANVYLKIKNLQKTVAMIKKETNSRLLYIPATVLSKKNNYCYCGMKKSTDKERCHICLLPTYQHVEISCKEGRELGISSMITERFISHYSMHDE